MRNYIVVGMGEALFDCLPEGKKIGGAPANFAYHASQFGLKSYVVSAVGNDEDGDSVVRILGDKGLELMIARVPFPTGTVQVELDANGIPTYDIRRNVAWDNIPFTPELEKLARSTSAVCFGSLAQRSEVSRNTILRFLDAMPADGRCLKIFDVNLRQDFYSREVLEASMRRSNVLKINDDEIAIVGSMFGLDGGGFGGTCRALMKEYGLEIVILTCGTNGSYVFTADGAESFVDTPKVCVADTVGAGDSFTGAFTAAVLSGRSVREAHRLAVDVSAYVCTQTGAMPALPVSLSASL